MKAFHEKFIAGLKSAQAYTKFWVAVAGGVLVIVTQNVPVDAQVQGWITSALAIATAFSVFAFPNSVPPVEYRAEMFDEGGNSLGFTSTR